MDSHSHPHSPPPAGQTRPGELQLADLVRFLARNVLAIAAVAVLCALGWGLFAQLTARPTFRTTASVVVAPPTTASTLRRPPLSVTAYKQLLESPSVIAATRDRLLQEGVLERGQPLRVGQELRSRLFFTQRERRQEVEAAPMIELTVEFPTAAGAARTANLWAEVFLAQVDVMRVAATLESVAVFEDLYPGAQKQLSALEREIEGATTSFDVQLRALEDSWGGQLAKHHQETLDLRLALDRETEALRKQLPAVGELGSVGVELEALQAAFRTLQELMSQQQNQVASAVAEERAVGERLEATPSSFELHKALPDEVLTRLDRPAGAATSALTEELNPVWLDLAQRLARSKVLVDLSGPRAEQQEKLAQAARAEIQRLSRELAAAEGELDLFEQGRASLREQQRLERDEGYARLLRERETSRSALQRAHETEVAELKRQIDAESQRVLELAKSYPQVSLARAQLAIPDVRLGSAAVAPDRPLPRRLVFEVMIAFVVGAFLGLALALVREVLRADREASA